MNWWHWLTGKTRNRIDAAELDRLIKEARREAPEPGHSVAAAPEKELAQTVFFASVFSLLGWVSAADGTVAAGERAHVERFVRRLELPASQAFAANALFTRATRPGFSPDRQIDAMLGAFGGRVGVLTYFLEVLFDGAWSDSGVHADEAARIRLVSDRFGFSDIDFLALEYRFVAARYLESGKWRHDDQRLGADPASTPRAEAPSPLHQAYEFLGVPYGAPLPDVKKAYRELVRMHHPDLLESQGVSPELMNTAKEMTIRLRQAYETVVEARAK